MKPKTSPRSSLRFNDLTANSSPYFFVRSRVSIIAVQGSRLLFFHRNNEAHERRAAVAAARRVAAVNRELQLADFRRVDSCDEHGPMQAQQRTEVEKRMLPVLELRVVLAAGGVEEHD